MGLRVKELLRLALIIGPKSMNKFPNCSTHILPRRRFGNIRTVIKVHDGNGNDRRKVTSPAAAVLPNKAGRNDMNLVMGELSLGKSRKWIAVEGGRLVEDAVLAGLQLEKVFLNKGLKVLPPGLTFLLQEEAEQLASGKRVPEIHRVGAIIMKTWSALTTPPGIIGIFRKPQAADVALNISRDSELPVTIICDNIREPGNLGALLRTAAGVGSDVFLTKGCVDPWNMKVLRGACGAHFRLPITSELPTEPQGLLESLITKKIMQKKGTDINQRFSVLFCDSNIEDPRLPHTPSKHFRDVDYHNCAHSFLIVGGETEGISDKLALLAKTLETKGLVEIHRVRVPLKNGMESLNAATAFGVIVFEIMKQIEDGNRKLS